MPHHAGAGHASGRNGPMSITYALFALTPVLAFAIAGIGITNH